MIYLQDWELMLEAVLTIAIWALAFYVWRRSK